MPLVLSEMQVLPEGIHDASLEDIRERFGSFQRTSRRTQLFAKLSEYVDEVRKAEIAEAIIVDGSFIMGCIDEPEDIDIILVLPTEWDITQELRPYQYNLVSKRDVKRKYPFDLKTVRSSSPEQSDWIEFFSRVNTKWYEEFGFPLDAKKGLVRIKI